MLYNPSTLATPLRSSAIKIQRLITPTTRQLLSATTTRFFTTTRLTRFTHTPVNMVVHNLAEYVAFHQAKLRDEQARINPTANTPSQPPKKKYGVNPIRSKSSYTTSVIEGPQGKLVVLDCFATWCGPCKVIAPEMVKFSNAEEYKDKVDFYKIDVDEVPDVAQELGVRAMPTFMFFKNGEKVDEVVGANVRALEAAIKKHL